MLLRDFGALLVILIGTQGREVVDRLCIRHVSYIEADNTFYVVVQLTTLYVCMTCIRPAE